MWCAPPCQSRQGGTSRGPGEGVPAERPPTLTPPQPMLEVPPASHLVAPPASPAPEWRWGSGYDYAIRLAKQARSECVGNPETHCFWTEYVSRLLRARVLPFLPGRTPEPVTLVPIQFIDNQSGMGTFPPTHYVNVFYVCLEDQFLVVKAHLAEMRSDHWRDCLEHHVVPRLSWTYKGQLISADKSLASYGVQAGDTLVAVALTDGA